MYTYQMVSKRHYTNDGCNKLCGMSDMRVPNKIYVPWFLRESKPSKRVQSFDLSADLDMQEQSSDVEVVDFVKLNGLVVSNAGLDYTIDYRDNYGSGTHQIELRWSTDYRDIMTDYTSVIFETCQDNSAKGDDFILYYSVSELLPKIGYYSSSRVDGAVKKRDFYLNFGLTTDKYTVKYKDFTFGGTAYVLLMGYWGILLNDDLSFDALFTIKSITKKHEIVVNKFLYSYNPYIVKVVLYFS